MKLVESESILVVVVVFISFKLLIHSSIQFNFSYIQLFPTSLLVKNVFISQ